MNARVSLFHINAEGKLSEMKEAPYDSEDHIQRLLATHPEVLAGDQFPGDEPRRWILLGRELAVPDGDSGAARWSLDHLYLDQDGVPTLVVVKRRQDTRSRREVVGQMLDYAANGPGHWPMERLREAFAATHAGPDRAPDDALRMLLGGDIDVEAYWETVERNLRLGQIRLVFVVDSMPPELLRIVEFLARHLKDTEIYAVEVRQHIGSSGRVLATRVLGHNVDSISSPAAGSTRPSEEKWLAAFEERHGPAAADTATKLIAWMKSTDAKVFTTSSQTPSLGMALNDGEKDRYPFFITGAGKAAITLSYLAFAPSFADEEQRKAIATKLLSESGLDYRNANLNGNIGIPVGQLAANSTREGLFRTLDWIIHQLRSAPETA